MITATGIKEAIKHLEGMKRLGPRIMSEVRRHYPSFLREVAERAMVQEAGDDAQMLAVIPVLLDNFTMTKTGTGDETELTFKMGAQAMVLNKDMFLDAIQWEDFVAWVNEHKEKDQWDYKVNGEIDYSGIARRIMGSIEREPDKWIGTDQAGHGALNPTGLAANTVLKAVGDVSQFENEGLPVTPEQLSELLKVAIYSWLEAVLSHGHYDCLPFIIDRTARKIMMT